MDRPGPFRLVPKRPFCFWRQLVDQLGPETFHHCTHLVRHDFNLRCVEDNGVNALQLGRPHHLAADNASLIRKPVAIASLRSDRLSSFVGHLGSAPAEEVGKGPQLSLDEHGLTRPKSSDMDGMGCTKSDVLGQVLGRSEPSVLGAIVR